MALKFPEATSTIPFFGARLTHGKSTDRPVDSGIYSTHHLVSSKLTVFYGSWEITIKESDFHNKRLVYQRVQYRPVSLHYIPIYIPLRHHFLWVKSYFCWFWLELTPIAGERHRCRGAAVRHTPNEALGSGQRRGDDLSWGAIARPKAVGFAGAGEPQIDGL